MFDMSTSGTSSAISSVVKGMLQLEIRKDRLDVSFECMNHVQKIKTEQYIYKFMNWSSRDN